MLTLLLTDLLSWVIFGPSSFNDGARRDWPMKQPSGLLDKEVSCAVFKQDEKAACRPSQCGGRTARAKSIMEVPGTRDAKAEGCD